MLSLLHWKYLIYNHLNLILHSTFIRLQIIEVLNIDRDIPMCHHSNENLIYQRVQNLSQKNLRTSNGIDEYELVKIVMMI